MNRCVALAFAVLLIVPVSWAQQGPDPSEQDGPASLRVAEDATGDNPLSVGGQDTSVSEWPAADLEALDLSEDEDGMHFLLKVADIPAPDDTDSSGIRDTTYEVYFETQGNAYMIDIDLDMDQQFAFAWLRIEEPQFGFYFIVESVPVEIDADAGTLEAVVSHDLLLDSDGVKPLPGDLVQGFWVYAYVPNAQQEPATSVEDRMPDSGTSSEAWEIRQGLQSEGHVFLHSPAPVRVSNGEATTFLFEVVVKNLADHPDTFEPAYEGGRDDWTVTFPETELRLDGGELANLPVLVTTPFNHAHGSYHPLNVTLQSRSDPLTVGRLELGVRYTAVPQPAGHHDTVHMHDDNGFIPYFNTLEEGAVPDNETGDGGLSSSGCSFSGPSGSGSADLWPLFPQLQIGLDFDLDAEGEANIVVSSDTPSEGYTLFGFILVYPENDRPSACAFGQPEYAAAEILESEPISLAAGETKTVTLPIRGLEYGDYLPYDANQRMGFLLGMMSPEGTGLPVTIGTLQGGTEPTIVAQGTHMRLPLVEYHDPVDDFFTSLSGIELVATTPQQRYVNPGETALFKVEATNIGDGSGTFDLEVTGSNVEWVEALGDRRIRLDGGESRTLAVAVSPPESATDGEQVDVTLHATKSDDPNVRSVIRLLAEVDTDADHIDEGDAAAATDEELSSKGLPGPAVPFLAAALALAALLGRRRR